MRMAPCGVSSRMPSPARRRGTSRAARPAATTRRTVRVSHQRAPTRTSATSDRRRPFAAEGGSASRPTRRRRQSPEGGKPAETSSGRAEVSRRGGPRTRSTPRSSRQAMTARPQPEAEPVRRGRRRGRTRAGAASPAPRGRWPGRSRGGPAANCSQRIGAVASPQATEMLEATSTQRTGPRQPLQRRSSHGAPAKIAATAANESWNPGSSSERGVQASSATAPSASTCQRSLGREASQASDATQPATAAAHDGRLPSDGERVRASIGRDCDHLPRRARCPRHTRGRAHRATMKTMF